MTDTGGARRPKQARSRETLDRLLDAAEKLLQERAWDEIAISDIVAEAGSSVGSFYARFPSKEDLLVSLLERYHADMRAALDDSLGDSGWAEFDLEQRMERLVARVLETCRRQRGLLRLRFQRRLASRSPKIAVEPVRDQANVRGLAGLFDGCESEIRHADPQQALLFALRTVDAVAMAALAFDDISSSYGTPSAAALEREITALAVAYLRTPPRVWV